MTRTRFFLPGLLAAALLLPPCVHAEEMSLQGNNEARWADGTEHIGGQDRAKRYFENRLNLDLYYGNLRFGSRFTVLQPSEFGETKTGINSLEKRFLEYNDPDINLHLRAGDFYTVWGRGLTLSLLEDINQGFDSGLDGVLTGGGYGPVEVEALAGRSHAGYLGTVREAQVNGAHVGATLPLGFSAGAQGMLVEPVPGVSSYDENRTYGGYLAFDGSSVSLWAEHANEYVTGEKNDHGASYLSASWFAGPVGVVVDYKRYHYYLYGSDLPSSTSYAQSVDILPFHSAPVVQREFTSALFSKHPHIVRFNDEVGYQVEVTYSPGDWGTLVLTGNQSSSYYKDKLWLPSLKEENSPYRQLFLELNAYPNPNWYLTAWTGTDEDLVYLNEDVIRSRVSWQRRSVLGTNNEISVSSNWSVRGSVEAARVHDVQRKDSFYDELVVLGLNYRTLYSMAVTLEATGDKHPQEGRSSWVKLEARAFLANRHEVLLTVGQERGGLVCTSGKCRLVTPFNGVKLTWTTLF